MTPQDCRNPGCGVRARGGYVWWADFCCPRCAHFYERHQSAKNIKRHTAEQNAPSFLFLRDGSIYERSKENGGSQPYAFEQRRFSFPAQKITKTPRPRAYRVRNGITFLRRGIGMVPIPNGPRADAERIPW